LVVVKESSNGIVAFLVEVGNGSGKIADRVQHKAGSGFFSFHREIRKEVHKALEETQLFGSISFNKAYILWSDCPFECLAVPKFVSSCSIGKADSGVLSSSYLIANVTEIRACHSKVYLAYFSEIALQRQG